MGRIYGDDEQLVVQYLQMGDVAERDFDLENSIDWDAVIDSAGRHGVTALVSSTLQQSCPNSVPDYVFESFRSRTQSLARQNLRMMHEVGTLSAVFEQNGIRAIPYKGPIVADVVYGDVGQREFGDIDFLVSKEDHGAARSVLLERGYDPRLITSKTTDLTEAQQWAYARVERDYPFEHPSEPIEVELHWRIVSQHFPTAIDLETVWDRRSSLSIAGTDVPVLSHEDRLLVLCVHGTRHRWERLQWVYDVTRYLESHSFNWEILMSRAKEHHCERMVHLGLAVAHDILGASLPERITQSIDEDAELKALRTHVQKRLFDDTDYWSLDLKRYQSRTLDRSRDRVRFWGHWLLKPNRSDVETVALPRPLSPLYSGVRVARLTRGAVSSLLTNRENGRRMGQ